MHGSGKARERPTICTNLLMSSTNERALELTDLLCEITPPQFNTVHLVSGGSEATETAMKIARQYHRQTGQPGRYKIISRYWAYHGGTLGALADKHEVVGQVTGEGLLLGIEYVRDGATHEPFPEEVAFAKQVDAACRERGLITRPSAHVQIIAPPLIPTDEQADEIVGTVDAAIGEVAARLAPRKSGTARKKPSAALTAGPGD